MKKSILAETHYIAVQRRYRFWLRLLVLFLGLPLLLYYGYCWGLWGRQSLLLQYLFQCNCPAASEEARYPDDVDVVVPACSYDFSRLSSSGHFLYVREEKLRATSSYLLDLQTQKKINFTLPEGSNYFLTDDLMFLSLDFGGGEFILDRTTGKQYPIKHFIHLQPNAYSYGKVDPDRLFKALLQVEKVFLIDDAYQTVIALSSDFHTHPEHSFTFEASSLPEDNANDLNQFLRQNNINSYRIAAIFPHEVLSPDGRLIARDNGIYLFENNQMIAQAPPSLVRGWTSDGKSVIYSSGGRCLIRRGLPFTDDIGCAIQVPQPVLKLNIPEEYLLP